MSLLAGTPNVVKIKHKFRMYCPRCNEFSNSALDTLLEVKSAKCKCGTQLVDIDEEMADIVQAMNRLSYIKSKMCCEGHFDHDAYKIASVPYISFYILDEDAAFSYIMSSNITAGEFTYKIDQSTLKNQSKRGASDMDYISAIHDEKPHNTYSWLAEIRMNTDHIFDGYRPDREFPGIEEKIFYRRKKIFLKQLFDWLYFRE